MVKPGLFSYSSTIETGTLIRDCKMNITLGLRALSLLAFVVISTAVIVQPAELMQSIVAISHP
jgi:hypothetical protein